MTFSKTYTVQNKHLDVQNIMDGLYYPFYMEHCRHDFLKEKLGLDLKNEFQRGFLLLLSEYRIKFIRSLKSDDEFVVTCELFNDADKLPRLHFHQKILCRGKLMTNALFTGTCIPTSGGRPLIPDQIASLLVDKDKISIENYSM